MDATPFSIGKHLSDLVGRHVAVKAVRAVEFAPETRTACYGLEPIGGTAVVQLDFALLASLAGTMIGVSPATVAAQVRAGSLDESMTDAAGELMNVFSGAIGGECRCIFHGLFAQARQHSARAQQVLLGTFPALRLLVTPVGCAPGGMLIVSDGY